MCVTEAVDVIRGSDGVRFVHAATAAFGTTAPLCRPPSEPVPA
jgi:hypothetical protein